MKEYIVQAYAQETIDEFNQRNASELVRCKDCKYGRPLAQPWTDILCDKCDRIYSPEWFCADGERR